MYLCHWYPSYVLTLRIIRNIVIILYNKTPCCFICCISGGSGGGLTSWIISIVLKWLLRFQVAASGEEEERFLLCAISCYWDGSIEDLQSWLIKDSLWYLSPWTRSCSILIGKRWNRYLLLWGCLKSLIRSFRWIACYPLLSIRDNFILSYYRTCFKDTYTTWISVGFFILCCIRIRYWGFLLELNRWLPYRSIMLQKLLAVPHCRTDTQCIIVLLLYLMYLFISGLYFISCPRCMSRTRHNDCLVMVMGAICYKQLLQLLSFLNTGTLSRLISFLY